MAPSYTTTARNALRALLGASQVLDVDAGFAALASDIDTKMLGYIEGAFGSRPAAGVNGRLFRATDTGQLFLDTGSTWEPLPIANALTTASTAGPYLPATPVTINTSYSPSLTRPAFVTLRTFGANAVWEAYVGNPQGRVVAEGVNVAQGSFLVPAGQSWYFIADLGTGQTPAPEARTLLL